MSKKRSKHDAYYSYRRRCAISGKPYMTLSEFQESRKNGKKRSDGSYLPEWSIANKRPLLMWLSKYDSIDKLNLRKIEIMQNMLTCPGRKSKYKNQLKRVEIALDLIKNSE